MSPVTRNEWDQLGRQAKDRARAAVTYAASNAAMHAGMRSRVDTGEMKGGWKVRTEGDGLSATVYNSQAYAIYHEQGTKHMREQPMLTPGLDAVEGTFLLMMQQVVSP